MFWGWLPLLVSPLEHEEPPEPIPPAAFPGRASHELLWDSAGDGFTSPTVEAGVVNRTASLFEEFPGAIIRAAEAGHVELGTEGLTPASGAVVLWLHPDRAHDNAAQSTEGRFFGWQSGTERIQAYHRKADSVLFLERASSAGDAAVEVAGLTFDAQDPLIVYAGWTDNELAAAFNGGAISTAANAFVPVTLPDTLEVGRDQGALDRYFDGVFGAVATFSRPLTFPEWEYLSSLARPPLFGEGVPRGVMTALWYGRDSEYFDDPDDQLQHDARVVSWTRGRGFGTQATARSNPGKLSAVLRNDDGRYSPQNASSPLFGLLLPGRSVRYRSASLTQHYARWAGRLASSPMPSFTGDSYESAIEAEGPLAELAAGDDIDVGPFADIRTSAAVLQVLEAAGFDSSRYNIFVAPTVMTVWWARGINPLAAVRELEDTEFGFLWERGDGVLVFDTHQTRITGPRLNSQVTFTDEPGAVQPAGFLAPSDPIDEVFNDVRVSVRPHGDPGPEEVLWTYEGPQLRLGPGASIVVTARYPQTEEPTGAYVDEWTTPDATDITISGVSSSFVDVDVVKSALTMEITLTNTHTSGSATVTLLRARGTPVEYTDPAEVRAVDELSQATYGLRKFPIAGRWLPDLESAYSYARFVLERHNEALSIVRRSSRANRSAEHLAAVLGLEISERVSLAATSNPIGVSGEFYVESITETVRRSGGEHEVSLVLSDAAGDDWPWVLGVDGVGIGTRLGW
jgi:hypothetical protein